MFSALGSFHDNEQSKLNYCTRYSTCSLFISYTNKLCSAQSLLPFLPSCAIPLLPGCRSRIPGVKKNKFRLDQVQWRATAPVALRERGLFGLAKNRLTRGDLAEVFSSFSLTAITKLKHVFSFYFGGCICR